MAALAELDLAFAKAHYADAIHAIAPELVPFRGPGARRVPRSAARATHPGSTIRLVGARHPLLDPKTVVPIDVVLDDDTFTSGHHRPQHRRQDGQPEDGRAC